MTFHSKVELSQVEINNGLRRGSLKIVEALKRQIESNPKFADLKDITEQELRLVRAAWIWTERKRIRDGRK